MEEPTAKPAKSKKLSRKDLAKMSTAAILDAARAPYRRLLGYIKPYRGRFAVGVLLGIVAGLFNGLLLLAIRAVFTVVLPPDPNEPIPTHIEPFKGLAGLDHWKIPRPQVSPEDEWIVVTCVCLCVPLLILFKGLFEYLSKYCILWVGNKVLYQVRDECFTNLLRQSLGYFNNAKQGELIQTVYNQARMASTAASELVSALVMHPVSILTIFAGLLFLDWKYTLGAIVVFPLCIVPIVLVSSKVRKAGGKEEEEAGMLLTTMQETFSGIRVVKANAREDFERDKFNRASQKMMKFIMRWQKATEIVGPMVETVASIGMAIGLVYAWHQKLGVHDFLILNMGLMSIYPHVKGLSRIQITMQKTLVATSKVFDAMDAIPEVRDSPGAEELKQVRGDLRFENVTYFYPKSSQAAVNDLTVTFEAGKTYALVGASGAGKSTIMSLILRFFDPHNGRILIDGKDIRGLAQQSLRNHIGMVNQEIFLFHDTIYNNIRYGRLDAKREEVEAAAKLAHAHDFILAKESGYDTELGDAGAKISGGEKQRISIARAFLRNTPILLLDEATSALDSEAERHVREALDELSRGKTVIAIAHRLSTVLKADQILYMKDGKVVAQAPHEELLESCEGYRRLYNLQFRGHEEDEIVSDIEVPG